MRPIITLLTDFGTADGYVAEMKGVLLTALPDASLVDVSHDIAPQDIESARLAVARYWRRFPAGTIHLIVVDPGVGTERAAIAVESEGRFLVGPDTGALSPALLPSGAHAVALATPPGASPTFHGRDIFAPAAARLGAGMQLAALGEAFVSPIIRRTPEPHRGADGSITGQVIHIDRFGNAITNLIAPNGGVLEIAGRLLPISRTYADVAIGGLVAIIGSSGLVEVAQRDGSSAEALGVSRGDRVTIRGGGR